MRNLLFIPLLFVVTLAQAGACVCHDGAGNVIGFELDANYGVCSTTNNCQYYQDNEFDSLKSQFTGVRKEFIKWDNGPTEMTQAEKDVVIAAEEVIADIKETDSINGFRVTTKEIWKAFLQLYNEKQPVENQITAQELKDKIKANKP